MHVVKVPRRSGSASDKCALIRVWHFVFNWYWLLAHAVEAMSIGVISLTCMYITIQALEKVGSYGREADVCQKQPRPVERMKFQGYPRLVRDFFGQHFRRHDLFRQDCSGNTRLAKISLSHKNQTICLRQDVVRQSLFRQNFLGAWLCQAKCV